MNSKRIGQTERVPPLEYRITREWKTPEYLILIVFIGSEPFCGYNAVDLRNALIFLNIPVRGQVLPTSE